MSSAAKQKGKGKGKAKPAKGSKAAKGNKDQKGNKATTKGSKAPASPKPAKTKGTKQGKDAPKTTKTAEEKKLTAEKRPMTRHEKQRSSLMVPPTLTNEESKLIAVDYDTITLDAWLEDHNYTYLAPALYEEIGVQILDDIKVISERDLNGMFTSLAKKKATVLNRLSEKAEIRFKRKFMALANGLIDYINENNNGGSGGGNTSNNNNNNNNSGNAKVDRSKISGKNAIQLNRLTTEYKKGSEFIKLFKNNNTS